MPAANNKLKARYRSDALIYDIEVPELIQHAVEFEASLPEWRSRAAQPGLDWYPHDSIGTLSMVDRFLTGPERFLKTLVGDQPVLDIGCADGALSFVFESLGVPVYAIDHPPTNFNRMRGVRALKNALRSGVHIVAADLDANPALPVEHCGLALFFGILYHLKNPLGVLEVLASRARYCLLSTAITRFAADQQTDLRDLPIAFLAGREGLKDDDTNYWIFTEAGLRVLVDRAGWEIRDWMVASDDDKTLWGMQRDERAFCLLRSRAFPPVERAQLLGGWHALENDAWRWTARKFSVLAPAAGTLTLKCTTREPMTIRCGSHAQEIEAGDRDVRFDVPAGVAEFELDHCIPADSTDGRERGLIVRSVEIR